MSQLDRDDNGFHLRPSCPSLAAERWRFGTEAGVLIDRGTLGILDIGSLGLMQERARGLMATFGQIDEDGLAVIALRDGQGDLAERLEAVNAALADPDSDGVFRLIALDGASGQGRAPQSRARAA